MRFRGMLIHGLGGLSSTVTVGDVKVESAYGVFTGHTSKADAAIQGLG
jgi:hypothetical protein